MIFQAKLVTTNVKTMQMIHIIPGAPPICRQMQMDKPFVVLLGSRCTDQSATLLIDITFPLSAVKVFLNYDFNLADF